MRDRRGFLLAEETLKIVIAIICIGFLVYFLTALYFKSSANEELEQAEATLERLVEEMGAGAESFVVYNPGNPWRIIGWPVDGEKPSSCLDWDNCLCFCKSGVVVDIQNLKKDCVEKGVCREITEEISTSWNNKFYIFIEEGDIPLTLSINGGVITKAK